jgi:ubiquinone/menaquinone biosynthesis C-methylase UbiE
MAPGIVKREEYTDESAAGFNEIAQTIFFPIYPVIANQILETTGIDQGYCIDVGSGPAHLAIALATLSDLEICAMDNSRPMLRIAEENIRKYRLDSRIRAVFGDVLEIPFNTGSVDLIVSRGSFFFWQNLSRGFSECLRALRPGGTACIGGGFGNARLRLEIVAKMRVRDPKWEEKRDQWYGNCAPSKVRSALAMAGIRDYDLVQDDSGYWVWFSKPK